MDQQQRQQLEQLLGDDAVETAAEQLGFPVDPTPIEGAALRAWGLTPSMLDGVGQLQVLAAGDAYRLLHLRGDADWAKVRRLILAVDRAAPEATVLWWWSSPADWTAAMATRSRDGHRRIRKLVIHRQFPDEVGLLQWTALGVNRLVDADQPTAADAWHHHFSSVLDQHGVTRQFFQRFSRGLDELIDGMKCGPDDEELRHEIALSTLLRVIFLYFLQARGALDGDRRFVMRRFCDDSRSGSFYRSVLRPLFFGALNRPPADRTNTAQKLGELPFLNGGLFEPTPAERNHPNIDWDDELWSALLEELFERHRFAVEWSDHRDLSRAVDPEMLGKVFEGLMYGDRRRNSGSFYTPRDVVQSMVHDTLAAWLCDETELEPDAVDQLFDGCAAGLSAEQRHRARRALDELTVLDPAVGTGAFLLEVLRLLRRVHLALDNAEGVVRTPGEHYERMRRLVHEHLCGVDIQPTAVRLCELRIWLAMLASLPALPADKMPPLPNLSHRLCTGNSLIDPLDWVRFSARDQRGAFSGARPELHRKTVERIAALQKSYTRAHGTEKRELKKALDRTTVSLQRRLLDARVQRINQQLQPYRALTRSSQLFDDQPQLDDDQRAEKQRLEAQLDALCSARDDLDSDRRHNAGFCFDARFAPVMARGGFDVVITNPPWVRSGRIDKATRRLYRARYTASDHGLWPKASDLNIRAPFGAQVDLAALFVERSLQLLRGGGRLCALLPVKLFRSLHGSALRGLLANHRVERLEDRSEDDETMFDATTYPAILTVKKSPASQAHNTDQPVDIGVWRSGQTRRFQTPLRNLCVHNDDAREPWMLVEPPIEQIFRKMQRSSVPLGTVEQLPIRGGVKTGCNAAFVLPPEEAKQKFSETTRRQFLRWAVRGRDIGEGAIERNRRLIWPVNPDGSIAAELPDDLERHFRSFQTRLQKRSDYRNGPIWTLFRRHDDITDPGVVWRDMGECLQAAVTGAEAIPMNTVYYLPAPSEPAAQALVALFHSEPMRAIAYAIAERARGGWRRHFAWVMRLLPVPRRWLAQLFDTPDDVPSTPAAIRQAYGLDKTDVRMLADWRAGTNCDPSREVA